MIGFNQVGYRPDDVKKVTFSGDTGSIPNYFKVVRCQDGVICYEGKVSAASFYEAGGEYAVSCDFSVVSEPGNYFIETDKGDETAEFEISEDVYKNPLKLSFDFFHLHRCGQELTKEEAGDFAHKACHNTPARIYGTDKFLDVTGGWHDAGDYGRYIVAAAKAVVDLLMTYEFFRDKLSDDEAMKYLEEIKYELDWMLKMQDKTSGGVYHKVTCMSFPGMVMPEEEIEELVISPISDTATYDFAAIMAYVYRIFGTVDKYKEFAEVCFEAGKKALEFTEKTPAGLFKNPEGVVTGEYDDYSSLDEKFWAYAEMYKATGDKSYEDVLLGIDISEVPKLMEWKEVGEYGFLAYVTAKNHSDENFYKEAYKVLTDHVDSIIANIVGDTYGYSMGDNYYWGCNMGVANDAMLLMIMDRINNTQKYSEYEEILVSYLFGNNPNGVCYLTGVGSNPVKHPHHRPSAAVGKAMPGMLAGGPEPRLLDDYVKNNLEGAAKAKCYADKTESYSTNEITIYWNSPLVFVLQGLV